MLCTGVVELIGGGRRALCDPRPVGTLSGPVGLVKRIGMFVACDPEVGLSETRFITMIQFSILVFNFEKKITENYHAYTLCHLSTSVSTPECD